MFKVQTMFSSLIRYEARNWHISLTLERMTSIKPSVGEEVAIISDCSARIKRVVHYPHKEIVDVICEAMDYNLFLELFSIAEKEGWKMTLGDALTIDRIKGFFLKHIKSTRA